MTGAPRLRAALLASVLAGGVVLGAAGCTDSQRGAANADAPSCVPAVTAPATSPSGASRSAAPATSPSGAGPSAAPATSPGGASPPAGAGGSPSAAPSPASSGAGGGVLPADSPLPDLALPCLDGGATVRIAGLGQPMIINLWASWCPPCRAELPAIQAYAASGRVPVLGVDTQDTTSGARSTIDDFGLTFPILSDPDKKLLTAIGRGALPATLFVGADGGVRYIVATGTPLTEADLARLAARYLGVGG